MTQESMQEAVSMQFVEASTREQQQIESSHVNGTGGPELGLHKQGAACHWYRRMGRGYHSCSAQCSEAYSRTLTRSARNACTAVQP